MRRTLPSDLVTKFLMEQQASLDELAALPDPAGALRELVDELHRTPPAPRWFPGDCASPDALRPAA